MNKFFLACLACLTFAATGNSQEFDQTLTSESLEPASAQEQTLTDEPASILEPTSDLEEVDLEPQSVTEAKEESADEEIVESDLANAEVTTELQIGEIPNPVFEQPSGIYHQPQSTLPQSTFIPSELNRIQPAYPAASCNSCQTPSPVVGYYSPPAVQPYPVVVSAAPMNQYVNVQPVQQMQVTRFTVYSYNPMPQPTGFCPPRMGPIERIFRRFR